MAAPSYVKTQILEGGNSGQAKFRNSEKTGYERWVWGLGWVEVEMVGGVEGI